MTMTWVFLVAFGLFTQGVQSQSPQQKIGRIVVRGNVVMNPAAIESMSALKVGDVLT